MSSEIRAKKKESSESPFLNPSLPDDIIVDISARVSRSNYPTISLVSKYFRSLVASPELYARRSLLGRAEACIYVVLYNFETKEYRLYFLHRKGNIRSLVPIPSLPPLPSSPSFAVVGSRIYVLGGVYALSIDCGSHTVHPISNIREPMFNKVANILDGKIYVIGERELEIGLSRKVVVVFDTRSQMWEPEMTKPDMKIDNMWFDCVVMADKMYMRDSLNTFVYRPKERTWETDEMLNSKKWASAWKSACVVDDILYYFDCDENKLRAYDPKQKLWRVVKGVESLLPEAVPIAWLHTLNYGGKLVVFFPKEEDLYRSKKIWCAEIAIERRQGGEIWGEVEWCNVVLNEHFPIIKSLAVMV